MSERESAKSAILSIISLGLTFGILIWLIESIANVSDGTYSNVDILNVLFGCLLLFFLPFCFRSSQQRITQTIPQKTAAEIRKENLLRRKFNLFKPSNDINRTRNIVKKCPKCNFENPAYVKKCLNCLFDLEP